MKTTEERRAQLYELWESLALIFLDVLKNTEPANLKASMLAEIRHFLTDNGFNADTAHAMRANLTAVTLPFPAQKNEEKTE